MKNLSPIKKRYSLFKHPMLLTKIHTLFSAVFFFLFTSSLWAQLPNLDKILASDGDYSEWFGCSVSISGDQLVIGAVYDDDNGGGSGSAYVYEKVGGVWTNEQKITASDGAVFDQFGYSVSISGDQLVIGAFLDDDNGFDSGSAYVYEKVEGVWTNEQKITASNGAAGDNFGYSVSISGDQLVIGAYRDRDNGIQSGSAYVYEKVGGFWTNEQKITASDGAAVDRFGISVSISGDQLVIGADGDDDNGDDSGSAYVYEKVDGVWTNEQKIIASDGATNDEFGWSVSISGDQLVIGAFYDDDNGINSGSTYVYEKVGGVWTNEQKITASDGAAFDSFGWSVSISGDQLVIGAYLDDDNGNQSGSAYIYEKIGGIWTNEQKITASDGAVEDFFGISVSISGDQLVIGAFFDDDNGSDSGSAYIGVQDVVLSFAGEQVQTYALYQNTPNPFQGETRIAFELPTAATATITIKDMNGNVVSVINGDYAKGYNSVSVEGLSTTGVMYYTLKSGDFTATKKMILVE